MVDDAMTIREAARRLQRNPHYVKGLVQGLGIKVKTAGRMRLLTQTDFERLEEEIAVEPASTTQSL